MPRHYLLSRTLDPLLGVFTGFLAYYLHETNPRTAPPPGHTLADLVRWQWGENARLRDAAAEANAANEAAELDAVRRELEEAPAAFSHATTGAASAASNSSAPATMVNASTSAPTPAKAPVKPTAAAQKDAADRAAAAAAAADGMSPASTTPSKEKATSDRAVLLRSWR